MWAYNSGKNNRKNRFINIDYPVLLLARGPFTAEDVTAKIGVLLITAQQLPFSFWQTIMKLAFLYPLVQTSPMSEQYESRQTSEYGWYCLMAYRIQGSSFVNELQRLKWSCCLISLGGSDISDDIVFNDVFGNMPDRLLCGGAEAQTRVQHTQAWRPVMRSFPTPPPIQPTLLLSSTFRLVPCRRDLQ